MKDDLHIDLDEIESDLLTPGAMPELQQDEINLSDTVRLESILQEYSDQPAKPQHVEDCNAEPEELPGTPEAQPDKAVVRLLITACCLCLGIIGILAYWLVAFF